MEETKKSGKKVLLTILIIVGIVVLAIGGTIAYFAYTGVQEVKNWTVFKQELEKIDFSLEDSNIDMKIYSKGKVGELEKYTKENISNLIAKSTSYENIVLDTMSNILSPDALTKDDADLTAHKEKINKIKIASNEFYTAGLETFDIKNWENKINEFNYPDALKQEFINILSGQCTPYYNKIKKAKEADAKIWEETEAAIDYLVENKSDWNVNNGLVEFNTQEVLDKYIEFGTRIQENANELANML